MLSHSIFDLFQFGFNFSFLLSGRVDSEDLRDLFLLFLVILEVHTLDFFRVILLILFLFLFLELN